MKIHIEGERTPLLLKPNAYKIHCTQIPMTPSGAHQFNQIVEELHQSGYNIIKRTPSGGISFYTRLPAYDIRTTRSCAEITVLDQDGMIRAQFRTGFNDEDPKRNISGRQTWLIFVNTCKKFNVDIDSLAVTSEEGQEYKKQIPKPIIDVSHSAFLDKIFTHAHHLDLNSSHMAGVAESFPVLQPVIEYMYNSRKVHPEFKDVLTHTWGYMQSKFCGYKFAHLSLAGLEYTNRRVRELSDRLLAAGRVPILYNIDGIWYDGDVYHADDEGYRLGEWKTDHAGCQLRVKTPGCYEFLDNEGIYTPVVRGHTKLDAVMPRENWTWGDIYNTNAKPLVFNYSKNTQKLYDENGEEM